MVLMPLAVITSGRLYHDFIRLLFFHAHREASALTIELPEECTRSLFTLDSYHMLCTPTFELQMLSCHHSFSVTFSPPAFAFFILRKKWRRSHSKKVKTIEDNSTSTRLEVLNHFTSNIRTNIKKSHIRKKGMKNWTHLLPHLLLPLEEPTASLRTYATHALKEAVGPT